jgi:hypothetical protein
MMAYEEGFYDCSGDAYLLPGFAGSTVIPDGPSGHSQETSGFSTYLKCKEDQLMCRIPMLQWTVICLSDSPNWV